MPQQQFSQLMPAAFENLISISDSKSPFYEVCTKHFIHSVFHRFPTNFIDGLKLCLAGCDTKSTPEFIFDKIIEQLGADKMDAKDSKPEYTVDITTASFNS
ncbi:unnamed protein product [Gongylonema pulchrum]|uniref:Epg5-like central TPR repeats domain-containing protein n=1 Tax=Gongylonema pulchrum TaxID=637853 RepID=A0A3P6RHL0_9BILA|nr:unnamed protein product [Gongylonema pulchrum]